MSVAVLTSASGGGAGHAARRLAAALAEAGIAADLFAADPLPADVAPPGSFARGRAGDVHFSVERPGLSRPAVVERLARYDVVNVHWAAGLVGVGEIFELARRGRRIVLTLHDFNHVTGGCHYPGPCRGWTGTCSACPQLDRTRAEASVPRRMRRARADLLALPDVSVTAPSEWLCAEVVAGGAVAAARAHVLRNPYRPLAPARGVGERGGAPNILLVADQLGERRKNLPGAIEALAVWRRGGGEGVVHLVGGGGEAARQGLAAAGVPFVAHGALGQAALTAVLAAADVVLTASFEDNWPNVLVEAGAFGAAAVVGPGHGAEEFVRRFGHGRVAADFSAPAFAAALGEAVRLLPEAAVAAAAAVRAEHAPETVAARFSTLFLPG